MSQHHSKGIRGYIFQVPGNPLPWSLLLFTSEVFSLQTAYFQINLLSYQRESGFGFFSLSLPSFIFCLCRHLPWPREKLSSFASSGSSQATTPQPTGITFPFIFASWFRSSCSLHLSQKDALSEAPSAAFWYTSWGWAGAEQCCYCVPSCRMVVCIIKAISDTSIPHKVPSPRLV